MPIQSIVPGATLLLKNNVVYALPATRVSLFVDTVSPGLGQSNTSDFASSNLIIFNSGDAVAAGGFIKSISGDTLVSFKRD